MEQDKTELLAELETMRVKAKNRFIITVLVWIVCIALMLITAITNIVSGFAATALLLALILAPVIFSSRFLNPAMRAYRTAYKEGIVKVILESMASITSFDPNRGIPKSEIENTGMMATGNRYSSSDYVAGTVNDVPFEQSDVLIEQETSDNDGGSSTQTIFSGRWMIFDFNKDFARNLLVVEKGFSGAKKHSSVFTNKKKRFEKVELENETFNKRFRVYAQESQDAYYILTPHIMEAILKLDESVHAETIMCFYESRLHVGLHAPGAKRYNPGILKPLNVDALEASARNDMQVVIDFVEGLRIDQDIFNAGNTAASRAQVSDTAHATVTPTDAAMSSTDEV